MTKRKPPEEHKKRGPRLGSRNAAKGDASFVTLNVTITPSQRNWLDQQPQPTSQLVREAIDLLISSRDGQPT